MIKYVSDVLCNILAHAQKLTRSLFCLMQWKIMESENLQPDQMNDSLSC